jgi:hypothetical protein
MRSALGIRWTALLVTLLLAAQGCASIGPSHAKRDRQDYNLSLTESWKRQILLNVVKIRYVEPLLFVDIGEIVASYGLETGINLGASQSFAHLFGDAASNTLDLGLSGKYTDRPTITYRPMTGTSFLKGVMSPMPLGNVVRSIESGVSAAFILNLGVRSINGHRNEALSARGYQPAEPGFKRAVEILCDLQEANALIVEGDREVPGGPPPELFLCFDANRSPETAARVRELKELLGLDPGADRYALAPAPKPGDRKVISLQTYSLAQILAAVAARVEMPPEDVAARIATPGIARASAGESLDRIMVRSSDREPEDAFAALRYRGSWFWVDDHNLVAKRVFSFIMLAFTLLEDENRGSPLQLTIPAQ